MLLRDNCYAGRAEIVDGDRISQQFAERAKFRRGRRQRQLTEQPADAAIVVMASCLSNSGTRGERLS